MALYGTLAVILLLGILVAKRWPDQGHNYLAEAVGIVITVGIVDEILKRQGRLQRQIASTDAQARLLKVAIDAAQLLDSMPKATISVTRYDEYSPSLFGFFDSDPLPETAKEIYTLRMEQVPSRAQMISHLQALDARLAFEVTHSLSLLTPTVAASIVGTRAAIASLGRALDAYQRTDVVEVTETLKGVVQPLLEFISLAGGSSVVLRVKDTGAK